MQVVGGENLLVPIGSQVMDMNGMVIFNDTARCVWELLAEDSSVDELASAVAERFDVPPARARADVQTFLDEITRIGMIEQ
jgi:conjugal transfer/entry exclusion protein